MNCDSFLRLLHEIPLPRWSPEQEASAAAHCLTCESCENQRQQQQQLFSAFDQMLLPESSVTFQLPRELEAKQTSLWAGSLSRGLTNVFALFLGAGSTLQLFRESGFSWYWIADGRRLESVSMLLLNSPVLSVALTLAGLVYCLSLTTQASGDQL